jgi:hypothetical protein
VDVENLICFVPERQFGLILYAHKSLLCYIRVIFYPVNNLRNAMHLLPITPIFLEMLEVAASYNVAYIK